MPNHFVSLAIDHGTTNSCIAEMTPQGPRVVPAEQEGPTLPSAVYYRADGALSVGSAARRAIITNSRDGQGFTGYKLHIGGDRRYEFTAAKKSLTAPELGAIVIQTLLRAYYRASGIDARACVITIPAKFKMNSVEGTSAAARMAGLKYSPLIMEPVAAAMRYGFSAKEQHGEWMVFDLGGGTLDVSLVIARRGKLSVPDGGHAGDDNLGGSKFDNELAALVLSRIENDNLAGFRNNRRKYSNEWGRFLLAVEEAKIRLSNSRETVVELDAPLCLDDKGKEVMLKILVTRADYENLIRADAERAVEMCQLLLKSNRLDAKQVEKLILIGGPSKTPMIRNLLAERLGIPLEHSIDPMTAVAEGAAIYADQVELPEVLRDKSVRAPSGFSLRIEYERQSPVPLYCAVGIVDGPPASGLQVEIERLDGGWRSPRINVDPSGVFSAEVLLIESGTKTLSKFRTSLLDARGTELAHTDDPQIWFPALAVENRVANSLRVAVRGNRTDLLIQPGAELPAEGQGDFVTSKALKKGSGDDVLNIPILESVTNLLGHEDDLASGCLHVGTLRILGSDGRVTMDVPAGSEIEVRLKQDESRKIKAVAYIPLLGEEFEAEFVGGKFSYDLTDLKARLEDIQSSVQAIETLQSKRPVPEVGDVLDSLRRQKLIEGLATDLERAEAGDQDSDVRAYKRVVELEGTMRAIRRLQGRARIELAVDTLGAVVQGDESRILGEIRGEFSQAQTDDDVQRIQASISTLEYAVRGRPWMELQLDLIALSGARVSAHQHQLFNKATALCDSLTDKGGVEKATDADLAALRQMHSELEDAHPDLFELRKKALDEMGRGDASQVDMSDLESAKRR